MPEFLVPANIPWETLKSKELEECLYWLLDDMGAKDLVWRLGGIGAGAADGGRDLEAQFYMGTPDGELTRQKWWIEAKGRKGTVEPKAVRESVLNTMGHATVDVLVIGTNSLFSNATRDWVNQWQDTNPRPVIRLWDKNDLERLITKHPNVAARLFSHALSDAGRIEVIRSQFWNYCQFPSEAQLRRAWKHRQEMDWNEAHLFAIVAGEIANGTIGNRPWGSTLDGKGLLFVLGHGLLNTAYFCARATAVGSKQEPYLDAVGYLISVALLRHPAATVKSILNLIWAQSDIPADVQSLVMRPIIGRLRQQLCDVCTSDCSRVDTMPRLLTDRDIEQYWARFREPSSNDENDEVEESSIDKAFLVIECHTAPCKVGFSLNRERGCPLIMSGNDDDEPELLTTLEELEGVIRFRVKESVES
ncbi:MAG: restriction endonuclease [Longimicrobiaceae bacterium]